MWSCLLSKLLGHDRGVSGRLDPRPTPRSIVPSFALSPHHAIPTIPDVRCPETEQARKNAVTFPPQTSHHNPHTTHTAAPAPTTNQPTNRPPVRRHGQSPEAKRLQDGEGQGLLERRPQGGRVGVGAGPRAGRTAGRAGAGAGGGGGVRRRRSLMDLT